MAGQYSHRQFFRRMPHAQLEAYMLAKKVNLGIDFSQLKEKQVDTLFDAFTALSPALVATIEAEFQEINAIACEAGVAVLIDEASYHEDNAFVGSIAAINSFHAKAMWAFLEKKRYWRGATLFLHADNVSVSYWKKHNDLPCVQAKVEDADIDKLEQAISNFFYKKEGRGKNCKVEPYRRNNKEYFFAYPEDFSKSGVEWVNDALKTLAHHPAFEIIFVYSKNEGSLDIYAPKNRKAIPELQKIFAKTILGLATLPDGSIEKQVYDLAPLKDENFEFVIEPATGITSVVITQLRLLYTQGVKKQLVLSADTKNNPHEVIDSLKKFNLPPYKVTQARVKVTFDTPDGKRAKTRTFYITYPNLCMLNNDGKDLLIRKMLAKSGIEPKANT